METRTIVVVEDNAAIAQLIKEVLNDVPGYGAVALHDGAHAHTVAAAVRADLVILDIDLPVISGLDIYDRLRDDPETAGIPVLFMSAATHRDELARRGFGVYLSKPFDLDDLLDLVQRHFVSPELGFAQEEVDAERA